ncbi:MAG: hypothetical protein QXJ20_02600, partial [Candidatus Aenigmatarchaeota archaeon]
AIHNDFAKRTEDRFKGLENFIGKVESIDKKVEQLGSIHNDFAKRIENKFKGYDDIVGKIDNIDKELKELFVLKDFVSGAKNVIGDYGKRIENLEKKLEDISSKSIAEIAKRAEESLKNVNELLSWKDSITKENERIIQSIVDVNKKVEQLGAIHNDFAKRTENNIAEIAKRSEESLKRINYLYSWKDTMEKERRETKLSRDYEERIKDEIESRISKEILEQIRELSKFIQNKIEENRKELENQIKRLKIGLGRAEEKEEVHDIEKIAKSVQMLEAKIIELQRSLESVATKMPVIIE